MTKTSTPAATWAAELLHQGCVAVVVREVEAEQARQWLTKPCPQPVSPAVIYSADLLLRHLPALHQLARRLSARDPVTAALQDLCAQWPYSSAGTTQITIAPDHPHLEQLAAHAGLRRAYADRILDSGNLARVGQQPLVDDALRAALGEHPELSPAVAARLNSAATHD